jgi:hypothetical protein
MVRRYCTSSPSDNPYLRQLLFSIYVHALPEHDVQYPEDSIFHNRMASRGKGLFISQYPPLQRWTRVPRQRWPAAVTRPPGSGSTRCPAGAVPHGGVLGQPG